MTVEGKRHLGAALSSINFKEENINEKVQKWVANIEALGEIAKSEPHAAYAAYLHAEQHKYTYFKRTIADISQNLKPVDDAISNSFIPSLFGCEVNENERNILSLPIKEGGLGLGKVGENCAESFAASIKITQPLINEILNQSDCVPHAEDVSKAKLEAVQEMEAYQTEKPAAIKISRNPKNSRATL